MQHWGEWSLDLDWIGRSEMAREISGRVQIVRWLRLPVSALERVPSAPFRRKSDFCKAMNDPDALTMEIERFWPKAPKFFNISMTNGPILMNGVPKGTSWLSLQYGFIVHSISLEPMNHFMRMHPKNSAHLMHHEKSLNISMTNTPTPTNGASNESPWSALQDGIIVQGTSGEASNRYMRNHPKNSAQLMHQQRFFDISLRNGPIQTNEAPKESPWLTLQ